MLNKISSEVCEESDIEYMRGDFLSMPPTLRKKSFVQATLQYNRQRCRLAFPPPFECSQIQVKRKRTTMTQPELMKMEADNQPSYFWR